MLSLLGLAFLVGMQHALEADHVAAVSSLAAGRRRLGDIMGHGLSWGLGHGAALFVFAGAALLLGLAMPEALAGWLETAVGLMLMGLGLNVLWRLWRDRIHFHAHVHGDGTAHFHAHSHLGDSAPHRASRHDHFHRFRWRSLIVGLTHGMAGSAALLVLAITQIGEPLMGLVYVIVFGIGSIAGMAVVSLAIGLPLALSARLLTSVNRLLQMLAGGASIAVGMAALLAG